MAVSKDALLPLQSRLAEAAAAAITLAPLPRPALLTAFGHCSGRVPLPIPAGALVHCWKAPRKHVPIAAAAAAASAAAGTTALDGLAALGRRHCRNLMPPQQRWPPAGAPPLISSGQHGGWGGGRRPEAGRCRLRMQGEASLRSLPAQ